MRALLLLTTGFVVTVACSGSHMPAGVPTAPSPSSPTVTSPPVVGASSTAIPISVGQTVRATVALSDAACDTHFLTDAPDPCLRYAIASPTSGQLRIHVSSGGPSWLALRVGQVVRGYGVEMVDGAVDVIAGDTYEVSVALHQTVGANRSQSFELTTSLAP